MKKLIATTLACAMMFSLAACSGKQQETTVPESSETTTLVTETSETTKASETIEATTAAETTAVETTTETTAATTAKILTKKDYVKNASSKYRNIFGKKNKDYADGFYVPELLIKSPYADSVNKEIANVFEGYKKEFKKSKSNLSFNETGYYVFLTKEGILSIIFVEYGTSTRIKHHVWNIDVTTGEKADNARLAEIAGVKSIRQAAMKAVESYYDGRETGAGSIYVKNFKLVNGSKEVMKKNKKAIEKSLSEKYLNEKMKIGITNEGKLLFICRLTEDCGDTFHSGLITSTGDEWDYWYDNKEFVGPKF